MTGDPAAKPEWTRQGREVPRLDLELGRRPAAATSLSISLPSSRDQERLLVLVAVGSEVQGVRTRGRKWRDMPRSDSRVCACDRAAEAGVASLLFLGLSWTGADAGAAGAAWFDRWRCLPARLSSTNATCMYYVYVLRGPTPKSYSRAALRAGMSRVRVVALPRLYIAGQPTWRP